MEQYIAWLKSQERPPSEEQRAAWFRSYNTAFNKIERRCGTCGNWGIEDLPDDGAAFSGYCECLLSRHCDDLLWFDDSCNFWKEIPE